MRLKRALIAGIAFLGLSALASGCVGPTWSTVDLVNAENALTEAKAANAEQLAPYEYYRAQELLRKANEEWGYSDFGTAREYAELALEFADKARKKATTDPWNGPPEQAISE